MQRLYLASVLTLLLSGQGQAGTVDELQQAYREAGGGTFTAAAGERLWTSPYIAAGDGTQRSCGSCHGNDLAQPGKHHRTGKPIEPMAPSVNAERLSSRKQIEKWFKRNCKWTLGRECSAQEKGDLLAYLKTL